MPLELESEQFAASGGTAAAGVLNQLGRPSADRLTLLVRETVQNSWDARVSDGQIVHFQADGYELESDSKQSILRDVFAAEAFGLRIRERLSSDQPFYVLALSDFGTVGLGGPTRSDVVPASGEPTHFVDLLRNMGTPTERQFSGGTYGFGKAASYLASDLNTIAIFSRHQDAFGFQSRFIAAALGEQFETSGPRARRYTGRHWWGRKSNGDSVAEPCMGDEAVRLAALFGGPSRAAESTGTTIFVLAPILEPLSPHQAMERVAQTLTHYFWPKLVDGPSGTATMSFAVRWNGDDLQLPDVRTDPNLAMFASAFEATMRGAASDARVEPIECFRPKRLLGRAGFVQRFAQPSQTEPKAPQDEEDPVLPPVVLETPLQHIAVMRQPHFVVKYIRGPGVSWAITEYAGVFIADPELDSTFAQSEPPTHDDWVPDLLIRSADKTAVRIAHARIKTLMDSIAAPEALQAPPYVAQSVAEFAQMLGGLVPAVEPPGSRRGGERGNGNGEDRDSQRDAKGKRTTRTARQSLELEVEPRADVDMVDGRPCMRVRFRLKGAAGSFGRVSALPRVVLLDGVETDPPAGAELPVVIAWLSADRQVLERGVVSCRLPVSEDPYWVDVSMPSDATVSVSLDVEEVDV